MEGSAADRNGQLTVGDRIVSVIGCRQSRDLCTRRSVHSQWMRKLSADSLILILIRLTWLKDQRSEFGRMSPRGGGGAAYQSQSGGLLGHRTWSLRDGGRLHGSWGAGRSAETVAEGLDSFRPAVQPHAFHPSVKSDLIWICKFWLNSSIDLFELYNFGFEFVTIRRSVRPEMDKLLSTVSATYW